MHAGMDLGHPDGRGTPIYSVQGGTVERVIRDDDHSRAFGGYGNGVVVQHTDDTWALYAHMDRVDVVEGQEIEAGAQLGTMGNSSNGKFRGMGVHLHLELRQRRPTGESPFPGPYPRSIQQPFNNLDPRVWMEGKGLRFHRRGGFEILPGTEMAAGTAVSDGVSGLGTLPRGLPQRRGLYPLALGAEALEEGAYEPPARFDRDVHLGLTPVEWAAAGASALVLTGTAVGLVVMRSRRRGPPSVNRRRRTSRR